MWVLSSMWNLWPAARPHTHTFTLWFLSQLYWFKDGKQISPKNDHYIIQKDLDGTCTLHTVASTLDDDGNYTVMAANPQVRRLFVGLRLRLAGAYLDLRALWLKGRTNFPAGNHSPLFSTHLVTRAESVLSSWVFIPGGGSWHRVSSRFLTVFQVCEINKLEVQMGPRRTSQLVRCLLCMRSGFYNSEHCEVFPPQK